MNENYRIADLIVGIDGFDTLRERAEPWKLSTDAQADFIISDRECAPECSGEAAEYTESEEQFHRACLKYDAVLLHSSAIVHQGRAYCFSGPSGTGKSTHTALWQACCGDSQVRILDDDRPMLRKVDGVWYAYGTPWNGKNRIGYNGKAPLGGIVFLHQGEENRIVPLEMGQALASLQWNSTLALTGSDRYRQLMIHDQLLRDIPFWRLTCTPDVRAVQTASVILRT